jgi:hypothetical protein
VQTSLKDPPVYLAAAKAQFLSDGFCVIPGVLAPEANAHVLERLWAAADVYRQRGKDTYMKNLDPNASNIRVFDLLDIDEVFRDLIRHPLAMDLVASLLGPNFMISNFTANIARPGSKSMGLHSDQALVVPEPWLAPWSCNIIWCLHEVRFENGATLYIPGSHKVTTREELGPRPISRLTAFEAKAGSIIAMDGRVWHTSGANITEDEDRAMMFGYYSRDFLRPQVNWNVILSPETQASLDDELRQLLGLGAAGNASVGHALIGGQVGLQPSMQ